MIHAVFDITRCQRSDAAAEQIMTAMRHTAELLGCTVRAQLIEPFQPHGATCVLVLAESHITVSTWPEHRLAHIDVFTCRADIDPRQAIEPILDILDGQITSSQAVPRLSPGSFPDSPTPTSATAWLMSAVQQEPVDRPSDGVSGPITPGRAT